MDTLLLISGLCSASFCWREWTTVLIFLKWEWEIHKALQGNPNLGRRRETLLESTWKSQVTTGYRDILIYAEQTNITRWRQMTSQIPRIVTRLTLGIWYFILCNYNILKTIMRWKQLAFSENIPHSLYWF